MTSTDLEPLYASMTSFLSTHVMPLANDLWSTREAQGNHMRTIRKQRNEGYRGFLSVLAGYGHRARRDGSEMPRQAEDEIQIRLGLWLSSYFLGFPLPHVWERVRHFEDLLEGYIGSGALYDKLAGDIYRAERKTRARTAHQRRAAEPREEARILVLAFTPTVLIADEELKGNLDDGAADSEAPERRRYVAALEKLAGSYLRLQMWLYLQAGYPILYAFQLESAADALAKHLGGGDAAAVREAVRTRFRSMGGDNGSALLYGIPRSLLEGEVFTSCTLGREDGVLADRPQLLARSGKRSTWVRSQYLKLERDKVFGLIYGQKCPEAEEGPVRTGISIQDRAVDALLATWETSGSRGVDRAGPA